MKAYFDYQPHAILIREKSDGQTDRIIGEITPAVLIGMARICHGAMRDGIKHGVPPISPPVEEETSNA